MRLSSGINNIVSLKPDFGKAVSIRTCVLIHLAQVDADVSFTSFHNVSDEHIALTFKGRNPAPGAPLVRVHSECLTGDLFHSARCDCGQQLAEAQQKMAEQGGILLYMRQEGRGIGLYKKLDAYKLQIEEGLDTYAANRAIGQRADARDFVEAASMLKALGVHSIRLLTNNPDKTDSLRTCGIRILDVVPTGTYETEQNRSYLKAKRDQTGHTLEVK